MQTTPIKILSGSYRDINVADQSFEMVKDFKVGEAGSYVTVKNDGRFTDYPVGYPTKLRIKVDSPSCFQIQDGYISVNENVTVTTHDIEETDEEAMDRIAERFNVLEQLTQACIDSDIRALIVQGAPGVGKSHGISKQLELNSIASTLTDTPPKFNIIRGDFSALGLYAQLYRHSQPGHVLVLDDTDSYFSDEVSMNLLKSALDTAKTKKLSWNKDSRFLSQEGIPNQFEYHGSVIFVTNKKFATASNKMQPHLDALQSRAHFLDLTINTDRDRWLRILQVHRDSPNGLFDGYGFDDETEQEILDFYYENMQNLRNLDIRTVLKIADLHRVNSKNWQYLAKLTCFKGR